MTRILAVCLGNICRSPTAEAVIRARAAARGLDITVDGAGTGEWHIGQPPDPAAIRAAAGRGYDLTQLRARRVAPADFEAFDLILAMDPENQAALEAMRPPGNTTPVHLFLNYAPGPEIKVPDPYYTGDFDEALDLIEAATDGLIQHLASPD